jgi:hypothetical protein
MVEEQIDVRIRTGLPANSRAEQPKVLNTDAAQFTLMRFQQAYRGIALHGKFLPRNGKQGHTTRLVRQLLLPYRCRTAAI